MDTYLRLKVIESEAVPKENTQVETDETSTKTTYSCGCMMIDNFALPIPERSSYISSGSYDYLCKMTRYHVELCPEHEPLATENVHKDIQEYIKNKK